jgi:hypothetical protein
MSNSTKLSSYRCIYSEGTTREISVHAFSLARFVFFELLRWQHANGKPVAVLYHDDKTFSSMETQGPILNFNLLRSDGSYIGYAEVYKEYLLRNWLQSADVGGTWNHIWPTPRITSDVMLWRIVFDKLHPVYCQFILLYFALFIENG